MIKSIIEKFQGKVPWGKRRSSQWRRVRRMYLDLHPKCAVCGGEEKLEVHHITPFHVNPALELESYNLITLCESGKGGLFCHLAIGHLGNYRDYNKRVVMDAVEWHVRISRRGK